MVTPCNFLPTVFLHIHEDSPRSKRKHEKSGLQSNVKSLPQQNYINKDDRCALILEPIKQFWINANPNSSVASFRLIHTYCTIVKENV